MTRAVIPFGIVFLAALSLTIVRTAPSVPAAEGGDTSPFKVQEYNIENQ